MIGRIWGATSILFALVCLIPFLGWGNWLVIVFAIVGCIISAFSEGSKGLLLNVIALIIASLRLMLGGGII